MDSKTARSVEGRMDGNKEERIDGIKKKEKNERTREIGKGC